MYWKLIDFPIAAGDNTPKPEKKKTTLNHSEYRIQVGQKFQARIPALTSESYFHLKEDVCLWNPSILPEKDVQDYLRSVDTRCAVDEEKALWLLHKCNYNVTEALRQWEFMPEAEKYESLWNESERKNYQEAYSKYGKNFHAIQKVIRTKSVGDVIEYFYAHKKDTPKVARFNGNIAQSSLSVPNN